MNVSFFFVAGKNVSLNNNDKNTIHIIKVLKMIYMYIKM